MIDLIRGRKVQDALQTLRFTPKRAAGPIEKLLRSAIANAERKAEDAGSPLDVDELFVNECFVNEGARWKRLRPAPMGRAFRYQKRTAHICGLELPSIMLRLRNASRQTRPKRKRKRACVARRVACARL